MVDYEAPQMSLLSLFGFQGDFSFSFTHFERHLIRAGTKKETELIIEYGKCIAPYW